MKSTIDLASLGDGGFFAMERCEGGAFRWSRQQFDVDVPDAAHLYITLEFANIVAGNRLAVGDADARIDLDLLEGWQRISIWTAGRETVRFALASLFRPEADDRALGLMLRSIVSHNEADLHELVAGRHANASRNQRELESGAEVILSAPPLLRITTSKTCNIANEVACVYCSWDWAKQLEAGSPEFSPEFLERMGRFADDAMEVTDFSYGEPPLEKDFGRIVDIVTRGDRVFEFTSNGQSLSKKRRADVLGKPVRIYVSIDAATAAGYERYRDHRFDLVIENLRALCAEKGGKGSTLEVIVSYIVMASNLEEIEPFVLLAKHSGVDRINFRTLFVDDKLNQRQLGHYGHWFDYDKECLDPEQLDEVGERCRAAAGKAGVSVTIEWGDFVANVGPQTTGVPICSEPWKAAYVLNRGLMPCCYGRDPLVKWSEVDTENLEAGLEAALNSEPYRELRRELSAGKLGSYCKSSSGCPIVKSMASDTVTSERNAACDAMGGDLLAQPRRAAIAPDPNGGSNALATAISRETRDSSQ